MSYYDRFDFNVDRDDERTIITVSRCRYLTALYLLGIFRKRFGNWTQGVEIKMWGPGTLTNSSVNLSVLIPAPKNPKHTRDPYTKERVDGYFMGLQEYLSKASHDEIFMALKDEIGPT